VNKGVSWLIAAQHPDGGWGGGSHAKQDVRDPHQVPTDPATTAFTLLTLLRAGHTPATGEFAPQVRKGLEQLLAIVEKAPAEGAKITDITGTQPQSKLGQFVDTPLAAQYLARVVGILPKDDPLYKRADAALEKCVAKLQSSQDKDGGWGGGGGWASVLASSMACTALEVAQAAGKDVNGDKLLAAQNFQRNQVVVNGTASVAEVGAGATSERAAAATPPTSSPAAPTVTAKTEHSAGVEFYAFGGAMRGNATAAREADSLLADAKLHGTLPADAAASEDNLYKAMENRAARGGARAQGSVSRDEARRLAGAATQNEAQIARLDDEKLLAGFGNNGGEEYLSYLLTSESLVIAGGDKFHQWNDKIHGRLAKIQNADGSWSGMHCITSPVFCTAAVVQCLTTDRDAPYLIAMAEAAKARAEKVAKDATVAQKEPNAGGGEE
jgi:hypothetical protein